MEFYTQLFSICLGIILIISTSTAAPLTVRLESRERQLLRVTSDGELRLDGERTGENSEGTCFQVFLPTRDNLMLKTTIEDVDYMVAMDTSGQVVAVSDDEMDESESGSGVTYNTLFHRVRVSRSEMALSMKVEDKQCYLHFDSNTKVAKNACSSEAEENKEIFTISGCHWKNCT